ncbi:MAG: GDSL-type esterase/lipase family protein [Kiritimatiellae bacterium]|nr:GDSL-type esterase/lipase family protein [Kiritimatiellia bacterium]
MRVEQVLMGLGAASLLAGLTSASMASEATQSAADELASRIAARVEQAVTYASVSATYATVTEFESFATNSTWKEVWPEGTGEVTRVVEAKLWNAAIQAALDKTGAAYLPKRDRPYYISDPIVLKSGQRLKADRDAEIRLMPGSSVCMVRNEHIVGGNEKPVPTDVASDTNILIEGGVWTTLATSPVQRNGNNLGWMSRQDHSIPTYGVILLSNVRAAAVRNVTVKESDYYALQIANCRDFLIDGVRLDNHRKDGVHINGPSSYGVVRNVSGQPGDDIVALNAWDWPAINPCFGPIDNILVEKVLFAAPGCEIRLLPGTKLYADGTKLACPISDCVLHEIKNIGNFKIYDQPPAWSRETDYCDPIGKVSNVYFKGLVFDRQAAFRIAVHVDGLSVEDVQLNFAPSPDYRLVEFGALSGTAKRKPDDPSTWVDVYNPDADFTVRRFRLSNVRAKAANGWARVPVTNLVRVTNQKLNPDYPKTTPRGGTGKAIFLPDAEPIRIMCVGDSITAGFMDTPQELPFQFGYRGKLYSLLSAMGCSFQFVGVSSNGTDGTRIAAGYTPNPDLRALGQDRHCGFAGWRTANALAHIEEWVSSNRPDVVLLMVGINDTWHVPVAAVSRNLAAIVQTIVETAPDADVIVAQTIPIACGADDLVQYNTFIRDILVPFYVSQGMRVSTVDQYAPFLKDGKIDRSLYSNGSNHPSPSAYDRMAEIWFEGIQAVRLIQAPSAAPK